MKIIFWGTPEYSVLSLRYLINSGHDIVAVITQPDRRRRRGGKLYPSPVKELAIKENIRVFTPLNIRKDEEMVNAIGSLKADIYIVVAFGQILPKTILEQPKYGSWNSHASILPRWRGAAPIQWSLISGDEKTGISIMLMDEGLDTGPVLSITNVPISINDNVKSISQRLSKLSAEELTKTISIIESIKERNGKLNELDLIQQDEINKVSTYARMITKQDYKIRWNKSALDLHRSIMGLYPNAYCMFNNKRVKISQSFPILNQREFVINNENYNLEESKYKDAEIGEVVDIKEYPGILVKASSGFLLIIEAQIEGRSFVKSDVLIQQVGIAVGDMFGSAN